MFTAASVPRPRHAALHRTLLELPGEDLSRRASG